MMNTVRVFDFDIDVYGAYVVIRKEPICPGCASDGEVDIEIKRLKDDLEAVAKRMKEAIRERAKMPFLPEGLKAPTKMPRRSGGAPGPVTQR